ncbi:2,5-diamino-6-(ribosylamino)-4(3H)-pyrimidinone 5'-phosphate reductase [Thermoflexales bacterium]|nr:2,5-diamino-6-(ribosylamino)-4(3H)-pyrimidinone 5'-phosphate reductase [Thermoflexales bacterium]
MGNTDRPRVTLTYAQSLDGSIAIRSGVPLALSGTESMHYTHQLRAAHDAILIGIGTVLSDDPRLNVRLTSGLSPRPIVLDSGLRCPLRARCLEANRRPIVATTARASALRRHELEAQGVTVISITSCSDNESYLDLSALLNVLAAQGIRSLMVEGGARVITSFLRARLVDRLIITIAPVLVGGAHGVIDLLGTDESGFPRLRQTTWQQLGNDWVVAGFPDWSRP